MNFIKTILFFVLVSTPFHFAQALDLEEARQKKLVIEQPDGYLKANSPTAQSFVDDINKKRKAAYEDIARKEKIDVNVVSEKAAQKIKEKMGK